MRDPAHLWTPYGLRSLSHSHPEFGKGENYWKGPIWIQMNYLALSALHKVCRCLRQQRGLTDICAIDIREATRTAPSPRAGNIYEVEAECHKQRFQGKEPNSLSRLMHVNSL